MRTTFIALFFIASLQVQSSIIPERSYYSFLDIFNPKNKLISPNALIKATSYDQNGDLIPSMKLNVQVPLVNFQSYKAQASAVFEVIPSAPAKDDVLYMGTAFHIGNNLVLTNNHVLSRDFTNTTTCDHFRIKNHEGNFFSCKKVHYCHPGEDLCLIELAPRKTGFFGRGPEEEVADLPSLKLNPRIQQSNDNAVITAIGNSQGYGIHLSVARGLKRMGSALTFYCALRDGNSGGPILNDWGQVIGLVRTESKYVKLEGGKNSKVQIMALQNVLQSDPGLLSVINDAIEAAGGRAQNPRSGDIVYIEKVRARLQSQPAALEAFQRGLELVGAVGENHAASAVAIVALIRSALQNDPETLRKFNQSVLE